MQLVPQYYFSNLPPSESKDILQQAADHLPTTAVNKDQDVCDKCPEAPEQRCSIQWPLQHRVQYGHQGELVAGCWSQGSPGHKHFKYDFEIKK